MKREEIKFRAYWKNKMYKVFGFDNRKPVETVDITDGFTDWFNIPIAQTKFMQYTGLKDKHGKEIYEGDIVKFENMGVYPIWWDEDYCGFGSCWYSDFDHISKYRNIELEVVGNIYENPELLEGSEEE